MTDMVRRAGPRSLVFDCRLLWHRSAKGFGPQTRWLVVCEKSWLIYQETFTWSLSTILDFRPTIIVYFSIYLLIPAGRNTSSVVPFELFTPALTGVFSLKFKWQQVSLDHQNSSNFINRLTMQWFLRFRFFLWSLSSSVYIFKPLGNVSSLPTTFGITVTFMFHYFFSYLAKSRYLSSFSFSYIFTRMKKINLMTYHLLLVKKH